LLPDEVVLEIDGGISLETIDEARAAGAQLFVAGSSIFHAPDPAAAYSALAARLA
jgi:ribulose-phosphate 3-epimerase